MDYEGFDFRYVDERRFMMINCTKQTIGERNLTREGLVKEGKNHDRRDADETWLVKNKLFPNTISLEIVAKGTHMKRCFPSIIKRKKRVVSGQWKWHISRFHVATHAPTSKFTICAVEAAEPEIKMLQVGWMNHSSTPLSLSLSFLLVFVHQL